MKRRQPTVKLPEVYEKPTVKRHAVIMTMAPAGSKMGHGLFPFATKVPGNDSYKRTRAYRR